MYQLVMKLSIYISDEVDPVQPMTENMTREYSEFFTGRVSVGTVPGTSGTVDIRKMRFRVR
jgi:hypothetical protein